MGNPKPFGCLQSFMNTFMKSMCLFCLTKSKSEQKTLGTTQCNIASVNNLIIHGFFLFYRFSGIPDVLRHEFKEIPPERYRINICVMRLQRCDSIWNMKFTINMDKQETET